MCCKEKKRSTPKVFPGAALAMLVVPAAALAMAKPGSADIRITVKMVEGHCSIAGALLSDMCTKP